MTSQDAPTDQEPGESRGRLTRAGLLGRSLALLGAIGGSAFGAAELVASPGTKHSESRDQEILNLALVMARLQGAFYAEALRNPHLRGEHHQFAQVVGGQEREHVKFLAGALGSSAAKSPRFHFGDKVTNPDKFISTAVSLESTSVGLYNGQGVNLTPKSLAAAAKLVSVEARHAAWARAVAGTDPAPDAVDKPITVDQAKQALQPFLS
jgi:Ferritin-like domain